MSNKRVLRQRANEPTVDKALRDIYDELDKLQPIVNPYTDNQEPLDGQPAVVETSDGTVSSAVYMNNEWLVDINSNYQRIGTSGFISSLGSEGRSRVPIKNESVKYDDKNNIAISGSDKSKVLLKNTSGMLNVRNANDSADGDIRCASIKDSNNNKILDISAISSAVDHVKIANSATGGTNYPTISPDGASTNKSIILKGKGTGNIIFQTAADSDTQSAFVVTDTDDNIKLSALVETSNLSELRWQITATKWGRIDCDHNGAFRMYNTNGAGLTELTIAAYDDLNISGGSAINILKSGASTYSGGFAAGTAFGQFYFGVATTLSLYSASNYDLLFSALGTGDTILTAGGNVIIDKNSTLTSTGTIKGLHLDYDHTGISASGQTITGIGLDLDMNCQSVTHVGTVNQTGIDIDMLAADDGTQTNTGMDIKCTGANNNYGLNITVPDVVGDYHIKLMAADDAVTDYATFAVADTGDLTITTVGDGSSDSDIILDTDGDIYLNADASTVHFQDDAFTFAKLDNLLNAGALYLYPSADANDYLLISAGANGAATITTTANPDTTTATLTVQTGGAFRLHPGGGFLLQEQADAAADSAGYGQIWVHNDTPNNLCFTNDAGTDFNNIQLTPFILCSQFQDDIARSIHYLPIAGYFEQTSAGNEPAGFVAPFNMALQKVVVRCSEDLSGSTTQIGMWAINSGTTHTHHHTTGKNWIQTTGGVADTNAIFDFTGTVGLAGDSTGGSNAITAGQWVDFSILNDTDVTSAFAEFWITLYFLADMGNTI